MKNSIFQLYPIPCFIVDKKSFVIQDMNPKALDLIQIEKNQITPQTNITSFFAKKYLRTGEYDSVQLALPNNKKQNGSLHVISNPSNDHQYIISFISNNRTKNSAYQKIFEHSQDAIFISDKDLNLLDANPSFYEITGLTKEQVLNANILDLVNNYGPADSKTLLLRFFKDASKSKQTGSLEILNKHQSLYISLNTTSETTVYIGTIKDLSIYKNAVIAEEEKYKTLVETFTDGIFLLQDNLIKYVNREMLRITKYSNDELLGKSFLDFVPPSQKEELLNLYHQTKSSRAHIKTFDYVIKKKSGEDVEVGITAIPVTFQGKKAKQIILRDHTKRNKAAADLKASEEKFKFLAASTFEGVLVHNKGKIIDANDALLKMTGYSKKEAIGELLLDHIPYAKDKIKILLNIVKKKAGPYHVTIKRKDDSTFVAELQAKNVINKGEKVRITSVRDVTETFKIKKSLEESEQRYRSVFENTGTASCILDEDNIISLANSKFAKLAGYPINKIQNKMKWMEFVHPDDLKMMQEYQSRRINRDQTTPTQYEFRFINRHKKLKHILILVDMIKGSKKRVASLLDISERKRAENEMKEMNEKLMIAKEKAEESDRLKSSFLANMSHEIRTPMNGILGFTDLLQEPDLSGEERDLYIEVIKRNGQRMLETVNDLIDISKIETGQMETNISHVNINKKLNNLFLFFKPEAEKKRMKLIWDKKASDEECYIETDDQKLHSILTNLIKNAIKYSDEGEIEIGYSLEKDVVKFFVQDQGIGIPKDRIATIFQRFEQVDSSNSRAVEGSGLGLAISRAYVIMLGGNIWVESEPNKGSNFSFTISRNLQ